MENNVRRKFIREYKLQVICLVKDPPITQDEMGVYAVLIN